MINMLKESFKAPHDFEEVFEEIQRGFEQFQDVIFSDLERGKTWECDVKLLIDNFVEDYHYIARRYYYYDGYVQFFYAIKNLPIRYVDEIIENYDSGEREFSDQAATEALAKVITKYFCKYNKEEFVELCNSINDVYRSSKSVRSNINFESVIRKRNGNNNL